VQGSSNHDEGTARYRQLVNIRAAFQKVLERALYRCRYSIICRFTPALPHPFRLHACFGILSGCRLPSFPVDHAHRGEVFWARPYRAFTVHASFRFLGDHQRSRCCNGESPARFDVARGGGSWILSLGGIGEHGWASRETANIMRRVESVACVYVGAITASGECRSDVDVE
jgi:hypothetical protein